VRPALVTGGAGFIGSNLADHLARDGHDVVLLDDCSRAGADRNLAWLKSRHGGRVRVERADVRDAARVQALVAEASRVFHFAAQVAVTTSLDAPADDFEVNARGTLNVLEAIRALDVPPPLVYTSTNKVYGALADVALTATAARYLPVDETLAAHGVDERRPLEFHSPYGCSKGAADQYVLDYARSYGLPAVVFRMSCVYGPRQLGSEDQGWVAHVLRRALAGERVTLYGDGRQVRDVLFIDDLIDALAIAERRMPRLAGGAFNLGGGPERTLSLLELLGLIERLSGRLPDVAHAGWRTGDQRWYVSDTRRFQHATGWQPRVTVGEGVARLHHWLEEARRDERAPVEEARA